MRMGLNGDQLFERMVLLPSQLWLMPRLLSVPVVQCAWEDAGFMMAAGTRSGSDSNETDGIVDGHGAACMK